ALSVKSETSPIVSLHNSSGTRVGFVQGGYTSNHMRYFVDGNNQHQFWVNNSLSALLTADYFRAPQYRLSALNTAPASASATGTTGEIRITATHIYVCVATNTWVRAA